MSQKSKDLRWFGRTLPGNNRFRLACRHWRNYARAIESSGLTMNRGFPQKWGKNVDAHPIAFPVFGEWDSGMKKALFLNSRT
ncbi:hypothetical protein D3C76_1348530 [compost metagenome]